MFNYYIIYTAKDDIFCCIEENPEGLKEKGWRICEGKRMGHRYPSDVQFHMGRSYPGIVVPDLIRNLCGYCLVSSKLKEIIGVVSLTGTILRQRQADIVRRYLSAMRINRLLLDIIEFTSHDGIDLYATVAGGVQMRMIWNINGS